MGECLSVTQRATAGPVLFQEACNAFDLIPRFSYEFCITYGALHQCLDVYVTFISLHQHLSSELSIVCGVA